MDTFPERIGPLNHAVRVKAPKALGLTAYFWVHERARKLKGYNYSITCPARGTSADGKEISVNTVGRWLFGVPGYSGNVRIVPEGDDLVIFYPKTSPSPVHDLVQEIKETIEKEAAEVGANHIKIFEQCGGNWFDVWWLLHNRATQELSIEHRWNHNVYEYEEECEFLSIADAESKAPQDVLERLESARAELLKTQSESQRRNA